MTLEAKIKEELSHARRQLRNVRQQAPSDAATIRYFEDIIRKLEAQLRRLQEELRQRVAEQDLAPGTRTTRGITVEQARALVASGTTAGGAVGASCRELWRRIEQHGLRVVHGYHVGGGAGRPDWTLHVTISVNGHTFHLRVNKQGVIFDVTPRLRPAFFRAPGA